MQCTIQSQIRMVTWRTRGSLELHDRTAVNWKHILIGSCFSKIGQRQAKAVKNMENMFYWNCSVSCDKVHRWKSELQQSRFDCCSMSCDRTKIIRCIWNSRNKEFNHASETQCVNSHWCYGIEVMPLLRLLHWQSKRAGSTRTYHMPQLGCHML